MITTQGMFSLKEDINESINKWKNENEGSLDIAFKIMNTDLNQIISEVKRIVDREVSAHVRDVTKYLSLDFRDDFPIVAETLCVFSESIAKSSQILSSQSLNKSSSTTLSAVNSQDKIQIEKSPPV